MASALPNLPIGGQRRSRAGPSLRVVHADPRNEQLASRDEVGDILRARLGSPCITRCSQSPVGSRLINTQTMSFWCSTRSSTDRRDELAVAIHLHRPSPTKAITCARDSKFGAMASGPGPMVATPPRARPHPERILISRHQLAASRSRVMSNIGQARGSSQKTSAYDGIGRVPRPLLEGLPPFARCAGCSREPAACFVAAAG